MFASLAFGAFLLRVAAGWNKYLMWAVMSGVVQLARRTSLVASPEYKFAWWPAWGWYAAAVVLGAGWLANGVARARKQAADKLKEQAEEAAALKAKECTWDKGQEVEEMPPPTPSQDEVAKLKAA